jgi:hypothetical protein
MFSATIIYLDKTHDLKLSITNTCDSTRTFEDYIKKNDLSYLKIDKFEGKDAAINTYLQEKVKRAKFIDGYTFKSIEKFQALAEKEYLSKIKNWKNGLNKLLKNSGIEDKYFLELESKDIYYKYFDMLAKKNSILSSSMSATALLLKKETENFDFNDLISFENIRNYRCAIQFVCNGIYGKRFPDPTDRPLTEEEKSFDYYMKRYLPIVSEKVTNKAIKNYLFYEHGCRSISIAKKKIDEECYKIAMANLTNKHLNEDLKRIYKEKKLAFLGLGKGKISPKFKNYENYKGGITSLDDFKGKYVLINAWAPC